MTLCQTVIDEVCALRLRAVPNYVRGVQEQLEEGVRRNMTYHYESIKPFEDHFKTFLNVRNGA